MITKEQKQKIRKEVIEEVLEWIHVFKEKALWNRLFYQGKGYNAGAYSILNMLEEKIKGKKKKGGLNERSIYRNKDR